MPNKSLGQHWLTDRNVLAAIADSAGINRSDTVLEIGPGLGTLTSELLRRAGKVIAVEFDPELAGKLPGQFPGKNLEVVNSDILSYRFDQLPSGVKVVGNIPYYITKKIVRAIVDSQVKPDVAVLLIQKEVAERLAAGPGELSMVAIAAQIHYEVELGIFVPASMFTPPPKVDSQTVVMRRREQPLIAKDDELEFMRVVKAGFSAPRKKLRSSLAGGLGIDKTRAEAMLAAAGVSPDARAEQISVSGWQAIAHAVRGAGLHFKG